MNSRAETYETTLRAVQATVHVPSRMPTSSHDSPSPSVSPLYPTKRHTLSSKHPATSAKRRSPLNWFRRITALRPHRSKDTASTSTSSSPTSIRPTQSPLRSHKQHDSTPQHHSFAGLPSRQSPKLTPVIRVDSNGSQPTAIRHQSDSCASLDSYMHRERTLSTPHGMLSRRYYNDRQLDLRASGRFRRIAESPNQLSANTKRKSLPMFFEQKPSSSASATVDERRQKIKSMKYYLQMPKIDVPEEEEEEAEGEEENDSEEEDGPESPLFQHDSEPGDVTAKSECKKELFFDDDEKQRRLPMPQIQSRVVTRKMENDEDQVEVCFTLSMSFPLSQMEGHKLEAQTTFGLPSRLKEELKSLPAVR